MQVCLDANKLTDDKIALIKAKSAHYRDNHDITIEKCGNNDYVCCKLCGVPSWMSPRYTQPIEDIDEGKRNEAAQIQMLRLAQALLKSKYDDLNTPKLYRGKCGWLDHLVVVDENGTFVKRWR